MEVNTRLRRWPMKRDPSKGVGAAQRRFAVCSEGPEGNLRHLRNLRLLRSDL